MWGLDRLFSLVSSTAADAPPASQEIQKLANDTHQKLTALSTDPVNLITSLNQLYALADSVLANYNIGLSNPDSTILFTTYQRVLEKITALERHNTTAFLNHLEEKNDPCWQEAKKFIEQHVIFDGITIQQKQTVALYMAQLLQRPSYARLISCPTYLLRESPGSALIRNIQSLSTTQSVAIHICQGGSLQVSQSKMPHAIVIYLPNHMTFDTTFTFGLATDLISAPGFIRFGHELCHVFECLSSEKYKLARSDTPLSPTLWCYRKPGSLEYDENEHQTIEGDRFSENCLRTFFQLPSRGSHYAMDVPIDNTGYKNLKQFLRHPQSRRRRERYSESALRSLINEAMPRLRK